MPLYECNPCGFSTPKKTDYSRHIKTNKHREKVNEQNKTKNTNLSRISEDSSSTEEIILFQCNFCGSKFTRLCNLRRHEKNCIKSKLKDKDQEMSDLKKESENNTLKQKIELLEKQNENYLQQINSFADFLKQTSTPQTVNNLTFIVNNYTSTPVLLESKSHSKMNTAKTMSLVELVTMYYSDNVLVKFVGDYIVNEYKKEPHEQSMWSSDASRLTYIIRKSVNNKNMWAYDKKGLEIKKIVIDPALIYIKNELNKYIKKNTIAKTTNQINRLNNSVEIIRLINGGKLSNEINKYIAPEFAIRELKEIRDNDKPKLLESPKNIEKNNFNNSEDENNRDSLDNSEDDTTSYSSHEFTETAISKDKEEMYNYSEEDNIISTKKENIKIQKKNTKSSPKKNKNKDMESY